MRNRVLVSAIVLAAAAPVALAASTWAPWNVKSTSTVRVEGTSSVRSWRCASERVTGSVTTAPADAPTTIAGLQGVLQRGEISIPVSTLDCANGTMNNHMRNALQAQQNPTLRFRMTSATVTARSETEGTVRMNGTLSIAGRDNPVTIDGTVARGADGELRVRGSKQIQMTQWGVRPPSLMMGTMRVHDPVTIHFDVRVGD